MEDQQGPSETKSTKPSEVRYPVPSGAARDRFFQTIKEELADILPRLQPQPQNQQLGQEPMDPDWWREEEEEEFLELVRQARDRYRERKTNSQSQERGPAVFREPLEHNSPHCTYVWNLSDLFQMQWAYSIEWPEQGGPRIWVYGYSCWQRPTPGARFEIVENLPFDIPISETILCGLAQHAGEEIYRRSLVVGSLKRVPQNFRDRAEEAAGKAYDLKLLREMSQREAATAAQKK
ncbi:MAG: hypothetical protein ACLQBJ_18845 [Bryobacteraceae bacterium]